MSVVMSVMVTPGATAFTLIPLGADFLGQGLGESEQPGLGGGVVGDTGEPYLAESGGDHDDRPGALLDHPREDGPAAEESAGQVDVDHLPPLLDRHLRHPVLRHHAGVVDQGVELAETLDHRRDHRLHLALVADVGRERLRLPTGGVDRGDGGGGTFGAIEIADRDVGAGLGTGEGDRGADPTAGTGDQHGATGEGI